MPSTHASTQCFCQATGDALLGNLSQEDLGRPIGVDSYSQVTAVHIAAVVENGSETETITRLTRLLDFLGISWRVFKDLPELGEACRSGAFQDMCCSVIGSIVGTADLIEKEGGIAEEIRSAAESLFCYVGKDVARCSQLLRILSKSRASTLVAQKDQIEVEVARSCPSFTGPMHGLQVIARPGWRDYALVTDDSLLFSGIIEAKDRVFFFDSECQGLRIFVSCSADLPEIGAPLKARYYDVKDHFFSTVPLVMYLKYAFRDSCWQNSQPGACLIIDDPILRMNYGFCDFRQIDNHMRDVGFSTNISFIPWNWHRTSKEAAALVRDSDGRFSISIHGCDHTGNEFATNAVPTLNRKVALAKKRMERHRKRNAVSHDPIMVFPQGAFSLESLAVLQQHQFLAAVNTEVLPMNERRETTTIGDVWKVAIVKYGGFPLFTRRYPNHGLENFAFDLLLGKPCLIVEHHEFFKGGGQEATEFINAINSLNCRLQWRSLGQVVRRAYQWRVGPEGDTQVRMFANELVLHNQDDEQRSYEIRKEDRDSSGVEGVSVDGLPVEWKMHNRSIVFNYTVPSNTEISVQVRYHSSLDPVVGSDSIKNLTKTAVRRYLSEFRDTFLSRHASLMFVTQMAKSCLARR